MASFVATDAAFAGFRLLRERPRVILAWAAYLLVASVVSAALAMVTGVNKGVAALRALEQAGNSDPAAVLAVFSSMGPFLVLMLAFSLTYYSVIMAAAYRAYLRPDTGAFGALHLGPDELRMAGLMAVMFASWLAYLFVAAFAFSLVVAAGRSIGGPFAALVDLIASVALLGSLVYSTIRLSLAGPMTFDQGRIVFFRSWPLTHGRFWPMLWTYVLTTAVLLLAAVLFIIIMVAVLAVVATATGGGVDTVAKMAQPETLGGYVSPVAIAYLILNSVLSAGALAIFTGPSAEIYRAMSGGGARKPSSKQLPV